MAKPADSDSYTAEISCRLTLVQKRRLRQAARKAGTRMSMFIRTAVMRHCDEILEPAPELRAGLQKVIGAVDVTTDVGREAASRIRAVIEPAADPGGESA